MKRRTTDSTHIRFVDRSIDQTLALSTICFNLVHSLVPASLKKNAKHLLLHLPTQDEDWTIHHIETKMASYVVDINALPHHGQHHRQRPILRRAAPAAFFGGGSDSSHSTPSEYDPKSRVTSFGGRKSILGGNVKLSSLFYGALFICFLLVIGLFLWIEMPKKSFFAPSPSSSSSFSSASVRFKSPKSAVDPDASASNGSPHASSISSHRSSDKPHSNGINEKKIDVESSNVFLFTRNEERKEIDFAVKKKQSLVQEGAVCSKGCFTSISQINEAMDHVQKKLTLNAAAALENRNAKQKLLSIELEVARQRDVLLRMFGSHNNNKSAAICNRFERCVACCTGTTAFQQHVVRRFTLVDAFSTRFKEPIRELTSELRRRAKENNGGAGVDSGAALLLTPTLAEARELLSTELVSQWYCQESCRFTAESTVNQNAFATDFRFGF